MVEGGSVLKDEGCCLLVFRQQKSFVMVGDASVGQRFFVGRNNSSWLGLTFALVF